ncbi:MAG: ribonuclease P protein component [Firmicutes bacterium]|nr:ribonuclease P protein component [Candidatus Fermentithermobacillaceae bacterium]
MMGRFKPASFPQVMEQGRSRANRYLVLYYLPEPENEVRLAISVPRKAAKAVARNRVKRRVREVFRVAAGNLKAAGQFAFIVRKNAISASFQELEWAVKDLLRKMELWSGDGGA